MYSVNWWKSPQLKYCLNNFTISFHFFLILFSNFHEAKQRTLSNEAIDPMDCSTCIRKGRPKGNNNCKSSGIFIGKSRDKTNNKLQYAFPKRRIISLPSFPAHAAGYNFFPPIWDLSIAFSHRFQSFRLKLVKNLIQVDEKNSCPCFSYLPITMTGISHFGRNVGKFCL